MTTRHTITAMRSGSHPTMGDWDADYAITFTIADNGEPVFVSIDPDAGDHGAFSDIAQAGLIDWATDWLDENADRAMEKAAADTGTVDLATASGLPVDWSSTDHRDWQRLRDAAAANGYQPVQGSDARFCVALVWRKKEIAA